MIKFHEPFKSKNTKKYLEEVIKRNSYNDNYFTERCYDLLSEFYQTKNLLLTHSGTAALEMSAMLLQESNHELKQEPVIKLPSYTFSSTANAFLRSNFDISFLDVNEDDMILDSVEYQKLKDNEFLVNVNYANSTFDYPESYNHKLIEDAAQSFGVTFNKQPVGTFGRYGCISFHPTKNLHAGYGGLIIIKDNEEFELAKTIWERGTDRNKVISGQKNKYEWVSLGSSFQINELSASVLLSQLEEESTIRNVREEIYHTYKNILEDIELAEHMTTQKVNPKVSPNYHAYYIILKNNRANFIEFMSKNGIQTYIGYENLHSSYFGKKNGLDSKLPITDKLSPNLVRLPLHTGLKIEDVKYVCKKIREYFRL